MSDVAVFEAPDFALQKGGALPVARLVYKTLGAVRTKKPNSAWSGRTARSRPIAILSC
jgi:hypothetical protein